jgi:mannose-6-phosphate isomerase
MKNIQISKAKIYPKGWGEEVWIINNDKYCGKLLKFNAGAQFSDHFHVEKNETWYVLEGKLELRYYNLTNAEKITRIIKKGAVVHIPQFNPHQLRALEDSVVIEVSTEHKESDSHRIGKGDSQKK